MGTVAEKYLLFPAARRKASGTVVQSGPAPTWNTTALPSCSWLPAFPPPWNWLPETMVSTAPGTTAPTGSRIPANPRGSADA